MLDLWDTRTWLKPAETAVRNVLTSEIIAEIAEVPAERMFSDRLGYLKVAVSRKGRGHFEEIRMKLVNAFFSEYRSIRGYHACKPIRLDPYFVEGLRPLSRALLAELAGELLADAASPETFQQAIARADLSQREGRIFFCTDPQELVQTAGHYLIYGPESLCCLWDGNPRMQVLSDERRRTSGVPTFFDCAVPVELLSADWRNEIASEVITMWFQRRSGTPLDEAPNTDFCFSITQPLSPQAILGHFHPDRIPDPLRSGIEYISPDGVCPFCS